MVESHTVQVSKNFMSKRLVIDARCLNTGIGRYVMNLMDGLQHRNGFCVHALVRKRDAGLLRPLCDDITIVDSPIYGWREQWSVPRAARQADLLHIPHYNVPVFFRGDFLVTIHDLIHISDPSVSRTLPARIYARPMMHLAAHRASRIVTVSQYSKSRIVETLQIPQEKVAVIYNGVHPRFHVQDREASRQRVRATLSIDSPYYLYVGNLKPHKNLELLLRGFTLLRARGLTSHHLVIIGDDRRRKESLQQACTWLGIADTVKFIAHVDDDLLPLVYAAADLLILPSLLEGFGFPVIEAMACGTPVACSRSSALPEIAGEAAHFFDPSSPDDLADAVTRVLGDTGFRETLQRRGLDRTRVFSWEECARSHSKLYRELLQV